MPCQKAILVSSKSMRFKWVLVSSTFQKKDMMINFVWIVDKEIELYSIFGLRKLLDLPDYVQTPAEHKKNKKRKIAAE